MPKAKKAEAPEKKPVAQKAAEQGVPIEEYAERVRAAQSPSIAFGLVKSRVSDALEAQGYDPVEIFKVLKTLK